MSRRSDLERENGALRERLSRISGAIVHTNESIEFDTAPQAGAGQRAPSAGASRNGLRRGR